MPAAERKDAVWLEPSLVCEVAYAEWTKDGRLRHPSFQGLREDKMAIEVSRELPDEEGTQGAETDMTPTKQKAEPTFAGITLSSPDKVLYPDVGVTKLDLARYYEAIAPYILPYAVNRPISLVRCPEGSTGRASSSATP